MKKAFSLIELSIVILIIGILIAGVTQSSRLINAMRVATARNFTSSSPVASIEGIMFWYETSLETSFIRGESSDGKVITQWKDNNPQTTDKHNAFAGQRTDSSAISYNPAPGASAENTSGPTYIQNGINDLPTLRFTNDNALAYRYLTVDGNVKNIVDQDITAFAVVSYRSGTGWIIDRTCVNESLAPVDCSVSINAGMPLFGVWTLSGELRFDRRDDYGNTPNSDWNIATGYTMDASQKYVITLERKYGISLNIYVNGTVVSSEPDAFGAMNLSPIKIGRHADNDSDNIDVDISEVIFFSGMFKTEDRIAVEAYLGKKYGVKMN